MGFVKSPVFRKCQLVAGEADGKKLAKNDHFCDGGTVWSLRSGTYIKIMGTGLF